MNLSLLSYVTCVGDGEVQVISLKLTIQKYKRNFLR